jgi:hypothetical protein
MGIELNHSYRSIARKHAQDGQRDGVIASDSDRSGSRVPDPLKVILNQTDATRRIERIHMGIANVGDIAEPERRYATGRVNLANDP